MYVDGRDISVIEAYREAFEQPFAVRISAIGDDGYDVAFLPEMNLVGLHFYAHTVTTPEGEPIVEEDADLTIEHDVRSVEITDDEFGEVEVTVNLTDDPVDGSFELEDRRGEWRDSE